MGAACEHIEMLIVHSATEKQWTTAQLKEKLLAFCVAMGDCFALTGQMLWIHYLKITCSLDACTTEEMKSAVEWVSIKANQNRPVLALVNATRDAAEIMKEATCMIESKTKDVAVSSKKNENVAIVEVSLDRIHALIFAEKKAPEDEAEKSEALAEDKLIEMIKSPAFKRDINTVITTVKDCNQTWKQATQGMQGKVQP